MTFARGLLNGSSAVVLTTVILFARPVVAHLPAVFLLPFSFAILVGLSLTRFVTAVTLWTRVAQAMTAATAEGILTMFPLPSRTGA